MLSGEQRAAFEHVTDGRGLSVVVGYAGTGKSAMLGVAREAWESAGYTVRGAALSGIAAEGLEHGSGIASRTIASLEHQWGQGRELLASRDVLVIDEAGMVGTRQMERVLSHAADAGAKVVLVGDPQQLQAIEAGAAFRAIHERHGGVEISEVRRQHDGWQQDATRHLATGRTGLAIQAYGERGMVHAAETREAARGELIERWDRDRQASPGDTRIILTHTNDEVRELNDAARGRLRDAGELGMDVSINAERGERQFASGDRIMFLRNERGLGVKNGTLGTVEQVTPQRMAVRTDDGRSVAFDTKDYAHIDHGYAATIHKAQGMTVDRAHVLATPGMDSHGAYVAMSRHRDGRGPALWPRRLRRSVETCPHAQPRARQGHGQRLQARAAVRRTARHHFPRTHRGDRPAVAGAGEIHLRRFPPQAHKLEALADRTGRAFGSTPRGRTLCACRRRHRADARTGIAHPAPPARRAGEGREGARRDPAPCRRRSCQRLAAPA